MKTTYCPAGRAAAQRGLSLVELMVGITIGLFIVAGATVLASTQLGENRRLIVETQVQQDLRAAADIITRELRRAGYDKQAELLVWMPAASATAPAEPANRSYRVGVTLNSGGEKVSFKYDRTGGGVPDFGYRLVNGTIRFRQDDQLQDVTDRNTLEVTDFEVTRETPHVEQLACPSLCPDGTQACWPTMSVSDLTISITGRSTLDPNFVRTVTSRVRLRNDGVDFNTGTARVCP